MSAGSGIATQDRAVAERAAPAGMTRRGLLLFASMCVVWGIPYLFIRVAVGELSPAMLVFLRTGIAALILVPIALTRGGGLRPLLSRWRPLLLFAAIEVAVPWFFLSSAEQHISSSLTGLLISAVPLVATVITLASGNRDRIGQGTLVGLLIGVVGVAAIVGFDLRATSSTALLEIGLVVIGYALGPVILARYLSDLPSVSVIAVAVALTALVLDANRGVGMTAVFFTLAATAPLSLVPMRRLRERARSSVQAADKAATGVGPAPEVM